MVVDQAVVANNDSAVTAEDSPLTVAAPGVLANDFDADGDPVTVLYYSSPANGAVTVNPDGSFTYTPASNYSGSDSFDYAITDGPSGTIHYWGLDGDATDGVGLADGAISGAAIVPGHAGTGLSFDEINDYATVPDVSYPNAFTLSFWFKVDDNTGSDFQYIYSHGDVSTPNSLNVYISESGFATPNVMRTRILDSNDADDIAGLDVNIAALGMIGDGRWHQYTLTVATGVGSKVYIDGVLGASDGNGGDSINPAGSVRIGARNDLDAVRFYGGQLDAVQIFGRSLSGGEVANGYASGLSVGTVSIAVNPVNDAPVLADTALSAQCGERRRRRPGGGGGHACERPGGWRERRGQRGGQGIAITAADAANGSWWYSTDNGASWNALGTPSAASSRLLASDAGTRIAFQPNANYNGTIATAITFRAWDRSSGSNGGTADTSSNGGTTAFSSATDTASLTVNPVNDAPSGVPTITRNGHRRPDPHRRHQRHRRCRRAGRVQLPVAAQRRGHRRGDQRHLHPGRCRCRRADQRAGVLHRRAWHRGERSPVRRPRRWPTSTTHRAGVPTITGTVTEDQTLTADTSGIADADGLGAFSYQWLRDGVAIAGATGATYTLGDADVGAQISVQVSYTDGAGHRRERSPVRRPRRWPTSTMRRPGPTITGTVDRRPDADGRHRGIADADGLGAFSYQWLRDGVAIGRRDGATYTLGDADVGAQISVEVSYTDGQGTAESAHQCADRGGGQRQRCAERACRRSAARSPRTRR